MKGRRAAAGDPVHVGEPRFSGLGARPGDLLSSERVNQTGLPDIRPAHQHDFRQTLQREVGGGRGAYDELSGNIQWVIVSSLTVSTGSACSSAGRRPASGSVSAIFRTSSIVWTM